MAVTLDLGQLLNLGCDMGLYACWGAWAKFNTHETGIVGGKPHVVRLLVILETYSNPVGIILQQPLMLTITSHSIGISDLQYRLVPYVNKQRETLRYLEVWCLNTYDVFRSSTNKLHVFSKIVLFFRDPTIKKTSYHITKSFIQNMQSYQNRLINKHPSSGRAADTQSTLRFH